MAPEPLFVKRYRLRMRLDGSIAFIVLAVFFVSLKPCAARLAGDRSKCREFGRDDALVLTSLVPFLALYAFAISQSICYTLSNKLIAQALVER